jgi:hypothetical protein
MLQPDGSWQAPAGSKHRSLTIVEVANLQHMAKTETPSFEGPNDVPFEDHHPLTQEIFEQRGLKPKPKGK